MKKELLEQLEALVNSENPLEVQKEFNQLSTQLRSLLSAAALTEKEKGNPSKEAPAGEAELAAEGQKSTDDTPPPISSEDAKEVNEPVPDEPSTIDDDAATGAEKVTAPEEKPPLNKESQGDAKLENPEEAGTEEPHVEALPDEVALRFKEVKKAFKEKLADARQALEQVENETVATAKDLLAEMQKVVENEENIGKAFASFNAIQEKWKSLPKVSNDNYRDLNVEYNKLLERFFYNINIYKELKELDLKRNLEEKQKVLEDQKKLLDLNDMRLLEVEVRLNQDRWNEIGPTFKEEWEAIKDEFWGVTRNIYKKIQDFYNLRRAEQDQNLQLKKELLEKVKQINGLQLKAHKKWQEKTKEVIELQKQWKLIGFVPKEQAKPIWKEFREACDAFFESKRGHYEELHQAHEKNKQAKEALLAEAEELKDQTDWKATSDKLIKLQQQWKEIGPAHQRDENRLWRKFRAACDHFFQARKSQKSEAIEEQKGNLEKKEAIIEALKSYQPEVGKKESMDQLMEFSKEWREVGHVPFKDKDRISKAYRQLMDEKFAILKVDKAEKEKIRFEEKIDLLKASDATDKLVRKEKDFVRGKISKLESEINQYENNLGFFAQSKGAEKLKGEVMKKIEQAKEEVERLYEQLDQLNEVE